MADIKVERTSKYARPAGAPPPPPEDKKLRATPPPVDDGDVPSALVVPAQMALFAQEAAASRERITQLELQVREVESERRADMERASAEKDKLMREIIELEKRVARAEMELELRRSGRLKPDTE